jgi:Holliday junction resolvase RusA-like endonuclease
MAKRKREVRPDLKAEPGSTFSFYLDGNIPSKKNRVRFGSNGVYHDKKFSTWHKNAVSQLIPQWMESRWIAETSLLTITFEYESLRAKDLTNCAESIMDLFVDVYILKDDNFKVVPHLVLKGSYTKGVSKTTIQITI